MTRKKIDPIKNNQFCLAFTIFVKLMLTWTFKLS